MKKAILALASAVYCVICCMLLTGVTAQAYIDPSVLTYVIQAVAGVIVAIGAVAGIYWRKIKKKINNKLGVDENRNKEVESDEIIVKEESGEEWK